MAILISPSNNTGWGLGTKSMFGGATTRSDSHPVLVKQHYRAPWGSQVPWRRARRSAPGRNAVDETIESVVRQARKYARRRRRNAIDSTIESVVRQARRYGRRRRKRGTRRIMGPSEAMVRRSLRRLRRRRRNTL
nr:pVII protein [Lemur mastadenovirus]